MANSKESRENYEQCKKSYLIFSKSAGFCLLIHQRRTRRMQMTMMMTTTVHATMVTAGNPAGGKKISPIDDA